LRESLPCFAEAPSEAEGSGIAQQPFTTVEERRFSSLP
jgi:hypothetical protein